MARRVLPWLPADLLVADRFEQLSLTGRVHAPVLVMQGGRDTMVLPAMGRAVFEAANQPKRLWSVLEGGTQGPRNVLRDNRGRVFRARGGRKDDA